MVGTEFFTQQIFEDCSPQFRHLLGKRISIVDDKGTKWVGKLDFIGINPFHGKFQVTLDRTPLWPVQVKTLKVIE